MRKPLLLAITAGTMLALAASTAASAMPGGQRAAGPVPSAATAATCANAALCRAIGVEQSAPRSGVLRKALADSQAGDACPDGSGASCGSVPVPLDYRHPGGKQLEVAYKYYRHTTPGAAISTVTLIAGGPGDSSIEWGDWYLPYVLGDSYAAHDVLLVDQRGRGSSGPLVCDALQHGTEATVDAVRDCGKQLGAAAGDYTSAFAARDFDRVRAHLGIATLDFLGVSYGSMDTIAYATRFPSHVRSIVLVSGATPTFNDYRFEVTQSSVSGRREQRDLCRGSQHCDEVGSPLTTLAAAAALLRHHPLTGSAPDPEGTVRTVTVTQNTLVRAARFGLYGNSAPLGGWAASAAAAYLHGDSAPLLRLAAARDWEDQPGDAGDPADHSSAVGVAAYCTDTTHQPWRTGLTAQQRAASALAAMRRTPQAPFFPWSGTAMVADPATSTIGALDFCLSWPDTPDAEEVLPQHAVYPDVPVLALVGDHDSIVDETSTIVDASRFPHHRVVTQKGASHLDTFFDCPELTQRFVDDPTAAPGTCGPDLHWYLQPSFPKTVSATPTSGIVRRPGDGSTAADRKVVAATWRTLLDGWIEAWDRPDFTTSKGLRGGTLYDSDDGESQYDIDFTDYRFVSDLGVTGRWVSPFNENPTTGTFDLAGAGGSGTVTVTAHMSLDRDGLVSITGTVNGHHLDVTTSSF